MMGQKRCIGRGGVIVMVVEPFFGVPGFLPKEKNVIVCCPSSG